MTGSALGCAVRVLTLAWLLGGVIACAPERRADAPSNSASSAQLSSGVRAAFVAPDARGLGRAGDLHYFEEVLGSAPPDAPLPMLVLLHGLGDRPTPGWLSLSLPVAVRVVMPEAPVPWGDGFAWSTVRAIEATGENGAALAADLRKRAEQLAYSLTLLRKHRPTQGLPIVAGFSQGGMLAFTLAARHPTQLRLSIPIAGLLPEPLWPREQASAPSALPIIRALHGTADARVPIEPARAAVVQLASVGYDCTLQEFEGAGHTISPAMLTALQAELSRALATP